MFNRPSRPVALYRLHSDMAAAQQRLLLASAWFTDRQIAQTFVDSRAGLKLAILSKSDLARDRTAGAVDILRSSRHRVCIIGNSDWREGVMHHKFVVADSIVWLGSYNFTMQAQKNFETIIRVEDPELSELFWQEGLSITGSRVEPVHVYVPTRSTATAVAERSTCCYCTQTFDDSDMAWVGSGGMGSCNSCADLDQCSVCARSIQVTEAVMINYATYCRSCSEGR